jgi:hypothetical protein
MGKLTDVAIRAWIRSGERFEGRSDGDGLVLTWREKRTAPSWRLRYRFAGKPRVMEIGSYSDLALAAARQAAKELRAKIALGHDVAGEKQERKSTALARIEASRSVTTVGQLADEYFERMINGRWKHPNIVRSRIEKDIKPHLGKLALDAVEPRHIDAMLRAVVKRGAPTIANDVAPRCGACSTTPSSGIWCASTRPRPSTWRTQAARNWLGSGRCHATNW